MTDEMLRQKYFFDWNDCSTAKNEQSVNRSDVESYFLRRWIDVNTTLLNT